jgi:hypothetical protein
MSAQKIAYYWNIVSFDSLKEESLSLVNGGILYDCRYFETRRYLLPYMGQLTGLL